MVMEIAKNMSPLKSPLHQRCHCLQQATYKFEGNVVSVDAIYRVIQEESALLWEMIVWVILSKKVHTNMGPILNGYGVMTA